MQHIIARRVSAKPLKWRPIKGLVYSSRKLATEALVRLNTYQLSVVLKVGRLK